MECLVIIPIAGLIQFIFSVIIGPIIIGLQKDNIEKEFITIEIQYYNLLIISIYGILEYYSICIYFIKQTKSEILKNIIKKGSNITIILSLIYIVITPFNDIMTKKFLTVFLSFQLIFFSIFILSEIVFSKIEDDMLKNPAFIVTGAIFILFSSTCPIYYLLGYFAINSIPASDILNLVILITYTFFYTVLIYILKWTKI